MRALTLASALPLPKRLDHEFVLDCVCSQLGGTVGEDLQDRQLLACQGRMRTCYYLSIGDQGVVVKIREVSSIHSSLSRKEFEIATGLQGVVITPSPIVFGVVVHPESCKFYEYVVEEYLPFEPPKRISAKERLRLFSRIAAATQLLHTFPVRGFGDVLSTYDFSFHSPTWNDWVDEQIERARFHDLGRSGFIARRDASRAQSMLEELRGVPTKPSLYHGDLLGNWANLLVDEKLEVQGILDWEFAGSGCAFENEVASVLYCFVRDGVAHAERERLLAAILDGYGIDYSCYQLRHKHIVNSLLLTHTAKAMNRLFPKPGVASFSGIERERRILFARRARRFTEELTQERTTGIARCA